VVAKAEHMMVMVAAAMSKKGAAANFFPGHINVLLVHH